LRRHRGSYDDYQQCGAHHQCTFVLYDAVVDLNVDC
jgi:hypothetical protein